MSVEVWINSIVSLLVLAVILFFNQREKKQVKQKESSKPSRDQEIEDEEENEWEEFFRIKEKKELEKSRSKKFVKEPLKTVHSFNKLQKSKNVTSLYKGDLEDLSRSRLLFKPSNVSRLPPIPSIRGEFVDKSPQVRKVVKNLNSLRSLVICREIMDRPDAN